jgi:hypothetical protein
MSDFRDAYGKHAGTPESVYQEGYLDGLAAGKEEAAAREAALVEALEEIGQYTITCSMMSTNASSFIMGKVSAAIAAAKGDAP